jgi:hypothetical protein
VGEPDARLRFQSRYDLRALVSVIAEVAKAADPKAPEKVSQRRYDEARTRAGHPDAPTAKQTAARLGRPWSEVLALALSPAHAVDVAIGRFEGEEEQEWLSKEDVVFALQAVAQRLGKKTLLPVEYRQERRSMLKAAKRHRHPSELSLPTEGQIERIAGSWDTALEVAGLKPRTKVEVAKGIPITAIIELFLEQWGYLPSVAQVEQYSSAQGVPMQRRERGKPYSAYIAELTAERKEWGRWTPPHVPGGMKPKLDEPAPGLPGLLARYPNAQKRPKRWTREQCIDALVQLLAEWPSDRRLTEDAYQEVSRGRRDLPPLSSLQRGTRGGFSELMQAARAQRAGVA